MVTVGLFLRLVFFFSNGNFLFFFSPIFTTYYLVAYCSEKVVTEEIPANMEALVAEKRRELIETVSEVDDKLAEAFLNDEPISSTELEVCLYTLILTLDRFSKPVHVLVVGLG
jgi:translation elongation factor EF-G